MSDEALLREIIPSSANTSVEALSARTLERIRSTFVSGNQTPTTFFPALARRPEIVSEMERRFPHERLALIDRADRAMAGRFARPRQSQFRLAY
jgi:hypothetical protein